MPESRRIIRLLGRENAQGGGGSHLGAGHLGRKSHQRESTMKKSTPRLTVMQELRGLATQKAMN
jgi:hypothetical protein